MKVESKQLTFGYKHMNDLCSINVNTAKLSQSNELKHLRQLAA